MSDDNNTLAQATVSSGGSVQPTDAYDRAHGTYSDAASAAQPSSHGAQTSTVQSSFSLRGK